jgi:hypothetical protein
VSEEQLLLLLHWCFVSRIGSSSATGCWCRCMWIFGLQLFWFRDSFLGIGFLEKLLPGSTSSFLRWVRSRGTRAAKFVLLFSGFFKKISPGFVALLSVRPCKSYDCPLVSEGIGIGAHIQLLSFLGGKGNEERILSKDNKRRGLFLVYFWKEQQQWALGVGQDRNPTRKETTQNTHTHTHTHTVGCGKQRDWSAILEAQFLERWWLALCRIYKESAVVADHNYDTLHL